MALTNGTDSEHLTPDALQELRWLARSRPTSGRARLAKLGALRTLEGLERLERWARRRKPQPPLLPLLELSIGPMWAKLLPSRGEPAPHSPSRLAPLVKEERRQDRRRARS